MLPKSGVVWTRSDTTPGVSPGAAWAGYLRQAQTKVGYAARKCRASVLQCRARQIARPCILGIHKGGDMRVKVRQVGNSLTVTLPKEIALEMNLSSDMEVDLKVRDQVVVLEPVLPTWERLLTEVRRQAAERGLSEADVERALAESRGPRT
jgi:antitoxin component of MazEF toxin-antitoxin module